MSDTQKTRQSLSAMPIKEPKKEVVTDDEQASPARKKIKKTGINEEFSDRTDSSSSDQQQMVDEINDLKELNTALKSRIKSMEEIEKQRIGQYEKQAKEAVQEFIVDREKNIRQFKEHVAKMEAKLEATQKEIRQVSEENTQFKEKFLKMERELKNQAVYTEKVKCHLKEKMTKIGAESEQSIQKMTMEKLHDREEIRQLQEAICDHKNQMKCSEDLIRQLRKELSESMNTSAIATRQLNDRISKLENRPDQKCVCSGPPLLEVSPNTKVPRSRAEIEFQKMCIFCRSFNHKSINCDAFPTELARRDRLSEQNRCERCLEFKNLRCDEHFPCPKAMMACPNCVINPESAGVMDFHHPIVCRYNELTPYREMIRKQSNQFRKSMNLPPRFSSF